MNRRRLAAPFLASATKQQVEEPTGKGIDRCDAFDAARADDCATRQ